MSRPAEVARGAARAGGLPRASANVVGCPGHDPADFLEMIVRPCEPGDWPSVWAILEPIFRSGETYAVPRDISSDGARSLWLDPAKRTFVAQDPPSGGLLGTYFLKPNAAGPGSHVCNCGYAVAADARGRGVASALCQHSQEEAQRLGFRAMQFNLVVSSNEGAVRLWQKLGFAIVGRLPGAFRHPSLGFVDAFVMYKHVVDR